MPIEARIICGLFTLVVACVFGGFGVFGIRQSCNRKTKGIAADGVVVGHTERRHSGAASTTYSPEVEFQTPSGEKIVFVASFSSRRLPTLGRKVKVLYYPDNPQDADITAPLTSWILPLLLLALGLVCLFMSMVVWFVIPKAA
jgi:hypothetical protein